MKSLCVLFLVVLLISCRGTKNVTQTSNQTNETSTTAIDSLEVEPEVSEIIKDSLQSTETGEELKIIEESNEETSPQVEKEILKPRHQQWNELLTHYVSEEGNVDYLSFKKERSKLIDYINYLNAIKSNEGFENFSREEKLAYWINAYNALTIDLILRHFPLKSIKDIKDPWDQRYWKLGDKWYHLNEIEHKILRKMNEPRIHFAIVCASISCPKLMNKAFEAHTLDEQLTLATRTFLADPERNTISENNLELSKIFQWFTKDFKQDGSLIDFLNKYTDVTISENAKKRYKTYNWDLNE